MSRRLASGRRCAPPMRRAPPHAAPRAPTCGRDPCLRASHGARVGAGGGAEIGAELGVGDGHHQRQRGEQEEGDLANEALFYGDTTTMTSADFDLGSFNPMRGPAMTLAGDLSPLVDRDRHDSLVELSNFFAPSSTTTAAPATTSLTSGSSRDGRTRSSYVSNPLADTTST